MAEQFLTESTITSLCIMAIVVVLSVFCVRSFKLESPGYFQLIVEDLVSFIEKSVTEVIPKDPQVVLPLIGTLWIYILLCNLIGLIPGLHSPTADLSITSALALIVFFSVPYYGIRAEGILAYLKEYFVPFFWFFPFHVIGEITRTVTLAVRLYGNMSSMEIGIGVLLLLAGFLTPVAFLLLHLIEAILQAYIFGILALIYIASGMEALVQEK
ncbi:F0F1 ATP synthase subunit A [Methylacidiphilum caldifontis]|uniref:F0F1 ATP synthase subunit A n=1 Tax=Methylacidiphilum caldifontis TaxID=2795386 RepID=UPI001A8C2319|nr:F0F1 ATP synthase subunit A [Methylacidiphilum caldifontis]QSR89118.1 F0F1 ATP synthase subunit A [Methylacidiphilum caldifontis]